MQNKKKESNNKKPWRLLVTALKVIVVIAFILVVPLVNYNIDPSRLYHTSRADSLEIKTVSILLEGSNVANLSNCNERLLHREYLRHIDEPFDTIVIGSSRGALITKEMLNEQSMFNLSVSGATIEDIIGNYGYLHLKDILPKRLVISIDPWLLNDNFVDERAFEAFGDGINHYFTARLGKPIAKQYTATGLYDPQNSNQPRLSSLTPALQKNLFSVPYFQTSLQHYFSGSYAIYSTVEPTTQSEGKTGIVLTDGSFSYPEDYRNADEQTIIKRAESSLPSSILGFEDYTTLNSKNREMFESFLHAVIEDGVEVQFLLEPISPVLVDYMKTKQRYEIFFKTQDMFTALADKLGIKHVGTFDPDEAGLETTDFYDGYHVKPELIKKMISELND